MAEGVVVDLTNESGIELQIIWDWRGIKRYVNNLYIPINAVTDWDLEVVTQAYVDQLNTPGFLACFHPTCVLTQVKGKARGRPDAGLVHTEDVELVGTATGLPTPSWFTMGLRQFPDNVNRLLIVEPTTIFQQGRIGLPGVPSDFLAGDGPTGAGIAAYEVACALLSGISEGAVPADNPGFGLAMTRVTGGVLRAKAYMASISPGEFGTQLTARH